LGMQLAERLLGQGAGPLLAAQREAAL